MRRRKNSNTRYLCEASLIAALYVIFTFISAAFGLSGGPIQLRLSEALCFFAVFTPAAVPGMAIGCFVSNLLTGCALWDMIFGTLASFIGAFFCRSLRRYPLAAPSLYALVNIAVIPLIQAYVYSVEEALALLYLFMFVGEFASVYAVGLPLYFLIKSNEHLIFNRKSRPN